MIQVQASNTILSLKQISKTAKTSRLLQKSMAVSGWIMNKKSETIDIPSLFYCFVNVSKDTRLFKFHIVPAQLLPTI